MVGLDSELQDNPALLSAFLLDKRFASFGNFANKDAFAALWAPDEVVNDKVDAVFISDIFHVDIIA